MHGLPMPALSARYQWLSVRAVSNMVEPRNTEELGHTACAPSDLQEAMIQVL
ncbi:MAG: hypothetical protein MZV63_54885 [Marinilabiliales bacterium]|nr:hypothetical protein [Marinilabiliales bacterium]